MTHTTHILAYNMTHTHIPVYNITHTTHILAYNMTHTTHTSIQHDTQYTY